jgi:hypothetical protein
MKSAVRNRENRIIEPDSSQLGRSFLKTSILQRFRITDLPRKGISAAAEVSHLRIRVG